MSYKLIKLVFFRLEKKRDNILISISKSLGGAQILSITVLHQTSCCNGIKLSPKQLKSNKQLSKHILPSVLLPISAYEQALQAVFLTVE